MYVLGNSENSCGRKTFGRSADVRVLLEKGLPSKRVWKKGWSADCRMACFSDPLGTDNRRMMTLPNVGLRRDTGWNREGRKWTG